MNYRMFFASFGLVTLFYLQATISPSSADRSFFSNDIASFQKTPRRDSALPSGEFCASVGAVSNAAIKLIIPASAFAAINADILCVPCAERIVDYVQGFERHPRYGEPCQVCHCKTNDIHGGPVYPIPYESAKKGFIWTTPAALEKLWRDFGMLRDYLEANAEKELRDYRDDEKVIADTRIWNMHHKRAEDKSDRCKDKESERKEPSGGNNNKNDKDDKKKAAEKNLIECLKRTLADHENMKVGQRYGHTLRYHVGATLVELARRHVPFSSTYDTIEDAIFVIQELLTHADFKEPIIEFIMNTRVSALRLYLDAGSRILGWGIKGQDTATIIKTTRAVVVLMKDAAGRLFVMTSYPVLDPSEILKATLIKRI